MTTDIDPPVILTRLAEWLRLMLADAERVKEVWDEEPLFRVAAILAVNKLSGYRDLIKSIDKSVEIMRKREDVMKDPHLFFAVLGVTIKSTK